MTYNVSQGMDDFFYLSQPLAFSLKSSTSQENIAHNCRLLNFRKRIFHKNQNTLNRLQNTVIKSLGSDVQISQAQNEASCVSIRLADTLTTFIGSSAKDMKGFHAKYTVLRPRRRYSPVHDTGNQKPSKALAKKVATYAESLMAHPPHPPAHLPENFDSISKNRRHSNDVCSHSMASRISVASLVG